VALRAVLSGRSELGGASQSTHGGTMRVLTGVLSGRSELGGASQSAHGDTMAPSGRRLRPYNGWIRALQRIRAFATDTCVATDTRVATDDETRRDACLVQSAAGVATRGPGVARLVGELAENAAEGTFSQRARQRTPNTATRHGTDATNSAWHAPRLDREKHARTHARA
jgi:hypothetical protein